MPGASATKAPPPPRFGLAGKIFLASTVLVVAVLGVTFGVTSIQANRTADAAIQRALANTRRAVDDFLGAQTRALAAVSSVSAGVPQFRDRLLRATALGDRVDQAEEYRDLIDAAWVLVTDAEGILLARTDYPLEQERDLSRGALIANALSGEQNSGAFIDDRNPDQTKLFIAVATPLADANAAPQGVLVAAYELNDSLAGAIRATTLSDVVFFALDTLNRPTVVGSTLPKEEIGPALQQALQVDSLQSDSATAMSMGMRGEHLLGLAEPIRSAGGDVFGGFVAFRAREAELAAFRALQRTMIYAVAVGVLLALV
ncbi:MAG: hypothetical protein ACREMR_12100, partial [Gemmatimonadales bacterium]